MRLINTSTIELEEFSDDSVPTYVILSHTWGNNEVDFRAFQEATKRNTKTKGAGWAKITSACHRAKANKIPYIWIDTCCIDTSSSAELEQVINSMFRYYRDAKACYAFLEDVGEAKNTDQLGRSRWFRRGWTLQELLAPRDVIFFINGKDSEPTHRSRSKSAWENIGRRGKKVSPHEQNLDPDILSTVISKITGIGVDFLTGHRPLSDASVAARMSWAAGRRTTRREDRAYSLLGIFDVNMRIVYGEGDRAFERLQREIMSVSSDETILAWHYGLPFGKCVHDGLFAKSPDCYEECAGLVPISPGFASRKHYKVTNRGLKINGPVERGEPAGTWLMGLNCTNQSEIHRAPSDTAKDSSSSGDYEPSPRALVLCLTGIPGTGLEDTWRHSYSRPFDADSGAFLKDWIPDGDSFSSEASTESITPSARRRRRRTRDFYILLAQPSLRTLPIVILLESRMMRPAGEDARFRLLEVQPAFAGQYVERIDRRECREWMMDRADVRDVEMKVYFRYQHRANSQRYASRMRISITRSAVLAAEERYLEAASGIQEMVLGPPAVVTKTYSYPEEATSQQILSRKSKESATGSVWFRLRVLTYKGSFGFALGHTDKRPDGDDVKKSGFCDPM